MSQPKEHSLCTPRSRLANELIKFAQADGVLEIHGLQVALIDAAIALDNAATLSARSEIAAPAEAVYANWSAHIRPVDREAFKAQLSALRCPSCGYTKQTETL